MAMAVEVTAGKSPVAGSPEAALSEIVARDTIIAWYRGEFAAANAIIDALCSHIVQIGGAPSEYEAVFTAIHRRRLNWIPVLHMQRFFSIGDVANELRSVAANHKPVPSSAQVEAARESSSAETAAMEETRDSPVDEETDLERISAEHSSVDSPDRKIAVEGKSIDDDYTEDGASQEEQTLSQNDQICMNHEECAARAEKIKTRKGFVAKEPVKGHMVNVVKGLKIYEDVFTNQELFILSDYINQLHLAGRRGELSGETFVFFNKQMKGNKREIIQLGVPLFQPTNEEAASNIEPIPQILLSVIDHLTQWRLIPESKRPNSCIINFFDENEYSQPYFKPPHIENPISTLLLSETTMTFGRLLSSDQKGDYKGSLTLPLSQGSLLVMRGNSADMARNVICPSPNRRVSITLLKVRPAGNQIDPSSPTSQQSKAVTIWQPPPPAQVHDAGNITCGPAAMVPAWGLSVRAPVFMLAPPRPVAIGQGKRVGGGGGGTGVFLPWTVGPKRYIKHLPPRIQKRRLPSLPPPLQAQMDKVSSNAMV
ncbi:hypothetical protein HPP92_011510 [Vanilla planifolia]|uniref:Fe2OG dioxygenase domain-containing protein n=1 Tax=Vanilla planifolia TaxID=51239 RepID=A0A835R0U4_VANPL|nr:hypothetical protein HPP92_011510 [Vanilla planifolia]